MTNPIDPEKLDRLIDGELSHEEIRQLIQQIDSDAQSDVDGQSHWRSVSLAFIEDRIWETEIKKAVDEDQLPEQSVQTVENDVQPSRDADSPNVLRWFSLAAGILMAVSIGYLLGQGQIQPTNMPIATDGVVPSVASTDSASDLATPDIGPVDNEPLIADNRPEINNVSLRPEYHVGLQDSDGNRILGSDVPLYSLKDMQANYPAFDQPPISEELRDQLYKKGYDVNQQTRYISGKLEDGRRVVVPIRTINLSSGQ